MDVRKSEAADIVREELGLKTIGEAGPVVILPSLTRSFHYAT